MGGDLAKPFLPIAGRPLVLRTLDRMFAAKTVEQVVLVVAAEEMGRCRALLGADAQLSHRPYLLQAGGGTRQQSAQRGLARIGADINIVIIHDGARPFVSAALIDRCVASAAVHGAVVVGLPALNTIKLVGDDHWIRSTPDRGLLWEIQTPQIFQRDLIVTAHQWAVRRGIDATDDAMVVELMGKPVFVVEGERSNLKITVPEDLQLAEAMIRAGIVA